MSVEFNLDSDNNSISFDVAGSAYYVDLSKDWATSGQKVQGIDFSAKYYANQAGAALENINELVSTVANAEETAQRAAQNANVSAENALTYADNAQTSATNASTSETNAQTYANNASTSATSASTSATNAASSASSALLSATTAQTSETNALGYATNASLSATNAATSESNAEIWAEGTDIQVRNLGGVHSAKEWANVASAGQIQTNWTETDNSSKAYIQNKPDLSVYATDSSVNSRLNQKSYVEYQAVYGMTDGNITPGAMTIGNRTEYIESFLSIPTSATTYTFPAVNQYAPSQYFLGDTMNIFDTFELCIIMRTVQSLTFPNTVKWLDDEAPDLSETGVYFLVFRSIDWGNHWIGNLQGKWDLSIAFADNGGE